MYQWDFTVVLNNLDVFLDGILVSLRITGKAIVCGTVGGLAIAWLKNTQNRLLRFLANAFTDVCRSVPVLVVMIWLFYSLPGIVAASTSLPFRISPEAAAVTALAIYLAAILGDIFRSGINSVHPGQIDVARTLGFSWFQIQASIVLPQALRLVLAPVLGQYVATLLLSSLASVIAVEELLHRAQNLIANRYHSLEIYSAVALLYVVLALPITIIAKRLGLRPWRRRPKKVIGLPNGALAELTTQRVAVRASKVTVDVQGHRLLNSVSFEVEPGQTLAIIGPSGAGKTTLLRVLARLQGPTHGAVLIQSPSSESPIAPQIAYVPQHVSLWPHLSTIDNVALALCKVSRLSRDEARREAAAWLRRFGLGDRLGAYPSTLSGGEAQRVAIARALAIKPALLLLDEITSSLDPGLIGEITSIIKGIAHKGATMILVGHHLDSVYEMSDRVVFLKGGEQLDYGDTHSVFCGRQPDVAQFLQNHVLWSHRRRDTHDTKALLAMPSDPI